MSDSKKEDFVFTIDITKQTFFVFSKFSFFFFFLYFSGTIIFNAVETVDVYPKSDVHVERMFIRGDVNHQLGKGSAGWTGGGNITLNGAQVLTEM